MSENYEILQKLVDEFNSKKICVIGDLMLDEFIIGDSQRISPEAPVPVVNIQQKKIFPGGAGNVANNIAALGGQVWVGGVVGLDGDGDILTKDMKNRGINISGVIKDKNFSTIKKTRVVSRGQQVVRLDREIGGYSIDKKTETQLMNWMASNINYWDVIVVSDYIKGVITKSVASRVLNLARRFKKIVIVDTKPKHVFYFKNFYLLTPNQEEASAISGVSDMSMAGKIIQRKLRCNVLITQGAEGMTLFYGNKTKHLPAKQRQVSDIVGAGDTVNSTIALALACGSSIIGASFLANHSAGVVVEKPGTAVVYPEELKNCLYSYGETQEN